MPSELVWVALIAAIGPIIGFFAKPMADSISGWLQAAQRRREAAAAAARDVQDAMARAIKERETAQHITSMQAAKALALGIVPLAERVSDSAARDAVAGGRWLAIFTLSASATSTTPSARRRRSQRLTCGVKPRAGPPSGLGPRDRWGPLSSAAWRTPLTRPRGGIPSLPQRIRCRTFGCCHERHHKVV